LVSVGRDFKVWVFISLCSLLVWIIRWLPSTFERFYNIVFVSWGYYSINRVWPYSAAGVGMVACFIGVIVGLWSLSLVWKGNKGFFEIRKWVAVALALESVYFASLFPGGLWLIFFPRELVPGGFVVLGVAYLLQTCFTTPFLAILAFKINKYERGANGFQSWKWVGIAFSGYVLMFWVNSVFRWFDMVLAEGVAFFFSGISGVGALNSFVFMSLAVVFAVVGASSLAKQKKGSALRWLGLALAMGGLHFLVYLVYSYAIGALSFVWLVDIWAIPLLGLGVTLVKTKKNTIKTML